MKIKYFILLVCFSSFFPAQKMDLKISYDYNYLTDSTNLNSRREDLMVLVIKEKKSYFYSELKQKGDSALNADLNNGKDAMTALHEKQKYNLNKNSYFITKDFQVDQLLFSDKIMSNSYSYFEEIPKVSWKISNIEEEYLGYKITKATAHFAGRNYIAWFTTQIPISDGPYKFQGLPGLILKVADTKNNFVFTAIAVEKTKYSNLSSNMGKIIPTTKDKYLELKEHSVKNFIQFINSTSELTVTPVNTSAKPKEKPYNPIELH